MSIQIIAQVASILVIAGWLVFKELREHAKSKEYGLMGNPVRCRQHAEAINDLRDDVKAIKEHLGIL